MPRNKLSDLNNILFEQLERLNEIDVSEEQLALEIKKSNAISSIAKNIIKSGNLALQVKKYLDEYGEGEGYNVPALLESKNSTPKAITTKVAKQ